MDLEFNRRKTDNKITKNSIVSITLFGNFNVLNKDKLPVTIADKKAKAILAILCLAPNNTMDRSILTELLWPGRYPAQAKSSLRQCILKLGKAFEADQPELLTVSRDKISLNPAFFSSDAQGLVNAISRLETDHALAISKENMNACMLEDISINSPFNAYAKKLIEQFEIAVENKILQLKDLADNEKALTNAHRLYKLWHRRLDQKNKLPIAVLPFNVAPEDANKTYIGQGLTDQIIYLLGQISQLQMIGRRSSFLVANTNKTVQEIATTLKVKYLIDGIVRIDGEKIKIDVQLINGKTGFQEWAGQYQGDIHKMFALQEMVATNLVNELEDTLGLKLVVPKINQMTVSHKAYDLYLQGRALTKRIFGEGVLESAVSMFEQALALDDNFAECWAALAEANAYVMVFTPCSNKTPYMTRLSQCAEKALNIDPNCGLALTMKGVCLWDQNNPCEAIKLAYQAYEVSPNDAAVVSRLGSFLLYIGLSEKAFPFVAKAVALEPLDGRHLVHLVPALLNLGKVDEAVDVGQKATLVGMPSITLAYANTIKGEHDLAVKQYSQTRLMMNAIMNTPSGERPMTEEELDNYWHVVANGVCSGREDARQTYCRLLDHMYATIPDRFDLSIVMPAVWMGYAEMVFKTLEEDINPANFAALPYLWGHHAPASTIRKHPDFEKFCDKIGLIKAWEAFGWPEVYQQKQSELA